MSAYTNVTIPDQFGRDRAYISQEELEILNAKVKYLETTNKSLLEILNNIPQAIDEYGYCDLEYDNGKKQMKVVAKDIKKEALLEDVLTMLSDNIVNLDDDLPQHGATMIDTVTDVIRNMSDKNKEIVEMAKRQLNG